MAGKKPDRAMAFGKALGREVFLWKKNNIIREGPRVMRGLSR